MKIAAQLLEQLRSKLGETCPPSVLRLGCLELFLGPSPHAPGPALVGNLLVGEPLPAAGDLAERLRSMFPDDVPIPPIEGETVTVSKLAEWIAGATSSLLAKAIGIELDSGAAAAGEDGALFWVELLDEAAALRAISLALLALGSGLGRTSLSASAIRNEAALLCQRCAPRRPSPESRLLLAAARAVGIPSLPVSNSASIWQFGWGVRSELLWVTSSNQDGIVGGMISRYKNYQKSLFESLGLPTPRWQPLPVDADLASAARTVGFPCVVKPIDHGSGRGVTANIGNMKVLKSAVAMARRLSRQLILEAHEPGHDHRLMIVNGRLEMALRLDPPTVIGDGLQTVRALVDELNQQRAHSRDPGAPSPVPLDESLDLALAGQDLTAESVPEAGREVLLRTNANRSTGGTATNVLEQVHPQIRHYAELLAEATGFATVGIDYVTTDISKPHREVGGGFLEINGTPGMARSIEAGLVPSELARLVIGSRPGRIPVCLLIAAADRLEGISDALLAGLPEGAGLVSDRRAHIGAIELPSNPLRPNERVAALLRYRSLESLIIIWTEEDLEDWGMPLDAVDSLIILGSRLEGEWEALLKSRSATMAEIEDAAEAIRIVGDWQEAFTARGRQQGWS